MDKIYYYLICATQSPRREVISGLLKANLTSRIGFTTSSELDSRIILDKNGCAQLSGDGDALYSSQGRNPLRIQCPYISSQDIENICNHWRNQINSEEKIAA